MEWFPFFRLISTIFFIFGCWLLPENLAFAGKIMALPDWGGMQSPQTPWLICLYQCFSTRVPRNLRIPPVVSKGSTGPPVLRKQIKYCVRHLRPLDAFSRLLVGPKWLRVPRAIKIAAKGSTSLKRLKYTDVRKTELFMRLETTVEYHNYCYVQSFAF